MNKNVKVALLPFKKFGEKACILLYSKIHPTWFGSVEMRKNVQKCVLASKNANE